MNKEPKPSHTSYPSPLLRPTNWVADHGDYLYKFACARLDDDEAAHDLVQETFLSALEGMAKFEARSSERTWLTSILKYKIINLYSGKSKMKSVSIDSSPAASDSFFEKEDGHWKVEARPQELVIADSDDLENKELHRILQQCIHKLPVLWRNIFKLRYMEDECNSDICGRMNVTSSNYWVIIHRAKLNLRACIQKNGL